MKNLLFIFLLSLVSLSSYSQENTFKEYSYTEFFNLIEEEHDTIFQLSDAFVVFNPQTDSLLSKAGQRKKKQLIESLLGTCNYFLIFTDDPPAGGYQHQVIRCSPFF